MSNAVPSYSALDSAFAQFLSARSRFDAGQKRAFEQIVMALSNRLSQGDNCLPLSPQQSALIAASGLAGTIGEESPPQALVLEQNRLYLQRYWFYEARLAQQIKARLNPLSTAPQLETLLDRYFGRPGRDIDWQREAARTVAGAHFCIITGGPGTGKTTTVIKILALLQEMAEMPLHIALAAPTGKAVMRLKEAIANNKPQLSCPEPIKDLLPDTVSTLHRLLGAKPHSSHFQHCAAKPLVYDWVVVDEASMIDLALMSKLLDALKPGARLLLLGDKDQLASVESGAVLADLTSTLPAHTVELQKSHRFNKTIKALAEAINGQQDELAWQLIAEGGPTLQLLHEDLIVAIAAERLGYLQQVAEGADFQTCFQAFAAFGVLCANREGKHSVADINLRLEQHLAARQLIRPASAWYSGRPVMVTQNHPGLNLYNGDVGLCLPDASDGGRLKVFFPGADGAVRRYLPTRLPATETVFAMTVHKSQGSEFNKVLLVLPETINPILTKELLYTAITRARETLCLAATKAVFTAAIRQKIDRVTGLRDKLLANA